MPVRRHLTFANVASATALVVALAGSGAAVASGLAHNSVRSPQIANGQVKNADLGANAVTGPKVAPDSLTGADVKESTLVLPPGSRIAAGDADDTSQPLTDDLVTYATAQATAPAPGFLMVTAESLLRSAAGTTVNPVFVRVLVDGKAPGQVLGADAGTSAWDGKTDGQWRSQTFGFTVPVTRGTHTVELQIVQGGAVVTTVYQPRVTLLYVPQGTSGTLPEFD